MKTLSKILVLCILCATAIFAVMIFMMTRVAPPQALDKIDAHAKNIELAVKSMDKIENQEKLDNEFAKIINRAYIFRAERKIEDNTYDKELDDINKIYTPRFIDTCFDAFGKSTWHDSELNWMDRQIFALKQISNSNGSRIYTSDQAASLDLISKVTGDYKSAKQLCTHTTFTGVNNARNTISKANKYLSDPYLSNCSALVSGLRNVKPQLASSHYTYVVNQINQLGNDGYYTLDGYMDLIHRVQNAIDSYKDEAYSLYGNYATHYNDNYFNDIASSLVSQSRFSNQLFQ